VTQNARTPLSEGLVAEIAHALGAECLRAPFSLGQAAVYQLTVRPPDKAPLLLTLWPSLARADVRAGDCYVVFKGIDNVLLYPGLEVIFQRETRQGFLLVSCGGRVATAS
jgi:hypothetical protein